MANKDFEKNLTKSIQAVGLWMAEHAEELTPKVECRTNLNIFINWDFCGNVITPEISVTTDYVSKMAIEAMLGKENVE